MPHLTKLQQKYKDRGLVVIGVTKEEDIVDKVKKYVKDFGEKMDYTVAVDKNGATSKAYMDAFGQRGIPHAFVVDQKGRIAWHQNPHPAVGGLEDVIDKVLEGKFDVAAAKKLMATREKEALAKRRASEQLAAYLEEYFRLVQSTGNEAEAAKLGKKILESGRENASVMNTLSWDILTKEGIVTRDLKLALTAAEAANKASGGENAYILDTYALALFENGMKKEAVKVQEKAVKLAKQGVANEQMIAELEERLERFRKEAE